YLDATCGILVPAGNREGLIAGFAAAMVKLAANPAERQGLGAGGRDKAVREFDWDVKADRILGLYESARMRFHAVGR
ncbi:MAG: glycosyltransferase, partial [Thiobacillus sp.]